MENRLERQEALRLYTLGSAKLSREDHVKGSLSMGMYADLAVLSEDFFSVPEESIKNITSLLTIVGGKVVYGAQEFRQLDANGSLPASPDWSPARHYPGYYHDIHKHPCCMKHFIPQKKPLDTLLGKEDTASSPLNPWTLGCDCFAF